MQNEEDFRMKVKDMMDHPEYYSKDDYYVAFLDMTEKYLCEMVSSMSFEKAIIETLGEAKGEKFIEDIVTSNPAVSDLDAVNALEQSQKEIISNLLAFIDCEHGSEPNDGD